MQDMIRQITGTMRVTLLAAIAMLAFTTCGTEDSIPVPVSGVSLNKTTLSMVEGDTETLIAIIIPDDAENQEVTWKSSDDAVAVVDWKGKVTAIKPGSTTVSVTTKDGGKTATCAVTVTKANVPVTGVSLNKTSLSMVEGDTETLIATVSPSDATNQEVTWKSSDDAVVVVDGNGKVFAMKAGNATITVTTKDGEKTATCFITVDIPTVSVTGVTLNKKTLSLVVGTYETLVASVSPEDATNKKVSWESSDASVAIVDANGIVAAVKVGSTTIKVTTEDGGKTATCAVTVTDSGTNEDVGGGNDPDINW